MSGSLLSRDRHNCPVAIAGLCVLLLAAAVPAQAQDQYIGEIRMFAGTFAPRGWAFCEGQLLSIAQYTALFSLLGTTYGGDGRTTFALPDLRGRVPMHPGQGPGLSLRRLGEKGGVEQHTLTTQELPPHTHALYADSSVGTSSGPGGLAPARNAAGIPQYGPGSNVTLDASAVGTTGGGQPHSIMQPYLAVNYIIALEGIFPSRP